MNASKSVFLGWQDPRSRGWYPVGRLDGDSARSEYKFGYTHGAKDAKKEVDFNPLFEFPKFDHTYQSQYLFPLFENRILNKGRGEFGEYLANMELDKHDPLEILAIDGGYRVTDSFHAFPVIKKGDDGLFSCRFFLHGWRYVTEDAKQHISNLQAEEDLCIAIELNNPKTKLALQIQTKQYHMIGWTPHYLVDDLVKAMSHTDGGCSAKVVKVNPSPAASNQRVLIELNGKFPAGHEPMSTKKFQLIVPDK